MSTLLAIMSCHRYDYVFPGFVDWFTRPVVDRISGIRESWLKDVTIDYKIFYGAGQRQPSSDEVFLNCRDGYFYSFEKIRAIIQYALSNGYDYLLKCDDDVYVYWDRLLRNMPTADYVGRGQGWAVEEGGKSFATPFAPGPTYGLSRRSMEYLITSPLGAWAEDRWVGESLQRGGIGLTVENRFHLVRPTRTCQYMSDAELDSPNDYLTIHSLSPEQMVRHWRRNRAAS